MRIKRAMDESGVTRQDQVPTPLDRGRERGAAVGLFACVSSLTVPSLLAPGSFALYVSALP